MNLEFQGSLDALFDRRREFSAEPVAEVALLDRAAWKLVGYFERPRRLRPQDARRGERQSSSPHEGSS